MSAHKAPPPDAPATEAPTRRRVLRVVATGLGTAASAAVLGAMSAGRHPTADAQALFPSHRVRPPGALPATEFEGACIRCGSCAQVCPRGAIVLEDGAPGLSHGTPWVVPARRGCDLCLGARFPGPACTRICPTGALQQVERERVAMGLAEVSHQRCFPHADTGNCEACADACKGVAWAVDRELKLVGAYYTVKEKRSDKFRRFPNSTAPGRVRHVPVIDPARCVGCGLCVECCPHPHKAIRVRPLEARPVETT